MNRKEVSIQIGKLNVEIGRLERLKAEIDLLPKLLEMRQVLESIENALPSQPTVTSASRQKIQSVDAAMRRTTQNVDEDILRRVCEAVSNYQDESCTSIAKHCELSPQVVSAALRRLIALAEIDTRGRGRSKIYFPIANVAAGEINGASVDEAKE